MVDLTGKIVGGRYRILELIAPGPTATIYKAYQAELERQVAVKVFPVPPTTEAELLLARFEQEVRAIAALRHPHIISLIDFGSEDGAPYIVMEYWPGTTSLKARLDELAQRSTPMSWDEVSRIGNAVASALAYAHQRGVAHRDVKPTNVLLLTQGGIVLTDFGLASLARGGGDPAYVAPEQARGEPGDPRSDNYALGVLLYEMVTGRLPFEADTPLAMLEKHSNDPAPLPGQVNPATPPAVERVILKALAKNPADRYQNGSDMAGDLTDAFRAEALEVCTEPEPPKPPHDILRQVHVDFVVKGKVSALLDRGFSLDTGQGTSVIVSTLSRGDQLGLHPGDEVRVFGGPDPRTGIFRSSSTIRKIMPDGKEIEIKDEPYRRKRPRWKLW